MDSFAASPLGKEFFRRLWLSSHCRQCASTHLSSPSFVDIVLSNEFHSFIVDLCLSRSIFVSSAVVDPVSRSLESPRSFGCLSSSSSLVDRCLIIDIFRRTVYRIDGIFFFRRPHSSFRLRRSGSDIDWSGSVLPFVMSCVPTFRTVFRHPEFARFVQSLASEPHGPGAASAGPIHASFCHFIASFLAVNQLEQVDVLRVIHAADRESICSDEIPMLYVPRYVMPTLDPLLTFSDLILTPTPISLAMFLPPRLPSFVTSDHAFDLVLISILLVLMITVSSEDFMYLALFIFVEYSTFVDISSLILLVLYTYILIILIFFSCFLCLPSAAF